MPLFFRSNHRRCSIRKGVLRNFTKFTGKHLCQSLFYRNSVPETCNFIKKETLAQVFSCEFCEISKNTIFIEHLRATVSGFSNFIVKLSVIHLIQKHLKSLLWVQSQSYVEVLYVKWKSCFSKQPRLTNKQEISSLNEFPTYNCYWLP